MSSVLSDQLTEAAFCARQRLNLWLDDPAETAEGFWQAAAPADDHLAAGRQAFQCDEAGDEAICRSGSGLLRAASGMEPACRPVVGGASAPLNRNLGGIVDKSKIPPGQADALGALLDDHRAVKTLFKTFKDTEDRDGKESIAREVCQQLTVHATIEEEIFYPALRGVSDSIDDMLDEAKVEHQVAKDLIAAIEEDPGGDMLEANFTVLSEYVSHHVAEEEEELFNNVIKEKIDLRDVAPLMAARKEELTQEPS